MKQMATPSKQLPRELLSLVHHIELHRSGWWDKALGQLILYVLGFDARFMTVGDIGSSITDSFGISVDIARLDTQLEGLEKESKVDSLVTRGFRVGTGE